MSPWARAIRFDRLGKLKTMAAELNPRLYQVLWLNAPRTFEFRTTDLGDCADDQIICETIISAISPGTELAAYTGLEPLRLGHQYPRLLGYCNVARVCEVGASVTSVKPGQLVLTFQSHRSGFAITSSEILHVLGEADMPEKVVCAYLYHLGYNAVLRSGIRAGSRVLILGMGTLGTTTLAMCQIAGAVCDVITDHPSTRARALALGARQVCVRDEFDAAQEGSEPMRYDTVITTVNGWADWKRALVAARKLGTIAMLGFPGRGQDRPDFNPLDPQYVYNKQLRIEAIGESPEQSDSRGFLRFNERDNLAFIIDGIRRAQIDTCHIAVDTFSFREIEKAYEKVSRRETSATTALIDWSA
jgi:threonine dehydrogenase-like Zn-dependent dehydrogenase